MQISEQKYKNLVSDMRLDAEAYMPIYINIEKTLKQKKYTTLGAEAKSYKKGVFDINAECYCSANTPNSIPFVRILNLKNMVIDTTDIAYIPEDEHKKNIGTALYRNDLILSKTAIPACSLVTVSECNTSQDTIAIKLKNSSSINSHYLVVFLNSYYGKNQMKRWFTGNIQMHLNLTDSKTVIVPILEDYFQQYISKVFEKSLDYITKSNQVYVETETILLKAFGLIEWQPKQELSYVKNFSNVGIANRLDAEYFQPKYDELIEKIKSYPNGWDILGKQFNQNISSFKINDDKLYNYVEISSVDVSNGKITSEIIKGKDLPANAKIQLKNEDILISKVRPYRGAIALVEEDNLIGSGAFTVLHEKIEPKINKETLYTFLRLKPILDLTLKYNTGTSYPTITDNDVLNLPIPLFEEDIQKQVKVYINSAKKLQKQSKQLLEIAKHGVEKAIEENEDTAMQWIDEQLKLIGVTL